MESEGTKTILLRPLEKGLIFIGNGDSSSFGVVATGCKTTYGGD